jgi:hypothetical protein
MSTLRWAQWTDLRDYASHPDGAEDIGNRSAKDFYELWKLEHNDAGTHKITGFLVLEEDTYTGDGAASQVVTLTNTNLDIMALLISRPDTEYPVLRTTDMSNTKEVGTNAFQASMITDISTTGQFTVGNDATVNANTIVYNYLALGVE